MRHLSTPPATVAAPQQRALHHLWVSVLAQAARDAFRSAKSKDGCNDQDHRSALAWIGSRDFHMVCALAGKDGPRVATQLRQRLEQARDGRFDPSSIFYQRGGAALHNPAAKPHRRQA